ncbi:MAG: phosphate signaling complex protein PhoU [Planctomycetota bacterium]
MARVLQKEIGKLKRLILALGALVEENLHNAVRAITDRDDKLAQTVIERDAEIDQMEIDVEEEGLKILALHQPVAIDLRFIVSVLKINNDLERIGDLAGNIAERAVALASSDPVELPFDVQDMCEQVKLMLKKSLDALVNFDSDLARDVIGSDDQVDDLNRDVYDEVLSEMLRTPVRCPTLINFFTVSRGLERIADHATNIAQDVIYMLEGDIIRHKTAVPAPGAEGAS